MNKNTTILFDSIVANQHWELPQIGMDTLCTIYERTIFNANLKYIYGTLNTPKHPDFISFEKEAGKAFMNIFYTDIRRDIWNETTKQYPAILNLKKKQQIALKDEIYWKLNALLENKFVAQANEYLSRVYGYYKSHDFFEKYHYSYREYIKVEEQKRTVGLVPISEAVDLGLSVKWAPFNVGGEEAYYAWGEIKKNKTEIRPDKDPYTKNTYKFYKGHWDRSQDIMGVRERYTVDKITKYCTNKKDGYVDNTRTLEPEDDVAHVEWGATWRMPTRDELQELVNRCSWRWTYERIDKDLVKGFEITGPNGNRIFLPAYGIANGSDISNSGMECCYWTSSLDTSNNFWAICLDRWDNRKFDDQPYFYCNRAFGRCVRAVCPK